MRVLHSSWFTLSVYLLCFLAAGGCTDSQAPEHAGEYVYLKPSQAMAASPEIIELGKQIYQQECAACHGKDGKGAGEAAYLLYPRPRNLVAAKYRLVSTWEGVPTDSDLYFTISRGIPGSAMPSFSHLPEKNRWALLHYVKSLAAKTIPAVTEVSEKGKGIIAVPPAPVWNEAAQEEARKLFLKNCASCHGEHGKGDGTAESLVDSEGYKIRARDFSQGIFKGSPEPAAVYRRIIAGLPGTPMPKSAHLYGKNAWHLAHYVLSMSSKEQRQRAEMKKFHFTAARVEQIPEEPTSSLWKGVQGVALHLMPLWWRSDRPEILTVKALHDGKEMALLLVWEDITYDHTAIKAHEFRDAVAVQFSIESDPPFFAMGEKGKFVNIWMWKSERQADADTAFQDIDRAYPNIGIDSYPNIMRGPLEQPARHALTLEADPTFVTGWGAGNIVSDPRRTASVENLEAQGFGTLKARPYSDQAVAAKGVYLAGKYYVVLHRSLQGRGPNSVEFTTERPVSVAFAVWNGSAGDRDGKKSVTIWQELTLAK
jgi:mono/diheme cytochrome c family protein